MADYFAYWCLSDIYDQVGYVSSTFEQHYGMLNVQGLRKPSWHAHQLLSRLGTSRLATEIDGADAHTEPLSLKTAIVAQPCSTDSMQMFRTAKSESSSPAKWWGKRLTLTALNSRANNSIALWMKMGSPANLTRSQLAEPAGPAIISSQAMTVRSSRNRAAAERPRFHSRHPDFYWLNGNTVRERSFIASMNPFPEDTLLTNEVEIIDPARLTAGARSTYRLRSKGRQSGSALLIVLTFLILLTGLVALFLGRALLERDVG